MTKKLLHISANQLPDLNSPHHTVRIWEELSEAFDEYHIIGRSKNWHFKYSHKGNIHLHLIPALGKRNRSFFLSSFYLFYLVKRHRITHLLSQSSIWGGFTATLASRIFSIPHLVEIHGDVYFKYPQSPKFHERILARISRYSLKRATVVRSLSESMTRSLQQMGIENKIVEIPNRVNLKRFGPPKNDYSLSEPIEILSIGRFVPQKGYDIAIQSILQLQKNRSVRLRLVGGGKLKEALLERIGQNPNIELIDWVKQEDLIAMMRKADIYIQPSLPHLGEAMPRTILEAMAMGLPIVASRIAAIPGVLTHGQNALLVQPGNIEELSDSLTSLISDQLKRRELGQKAFQDAREHYEWSKIFALYRKTLAEMS
jgi:glycosyltransferase involved in cell wall biosynthesis